MNTDSHGWEGHQTGARTAESARPQTFELADKAVRAPAAAPAPSVPSVASVLSDAPTTATPAPANLEALWASLVEAAGRASPFIKSYLLEAHPVSFAKNVFTVGFDPEFADHISLIDNSKNHALLQNKLGELGHHAVQFKFIKAEAPANRARPVAPAPTPPPAVAPKTAPKATTADVLPPAVPKSAPVAFSQDDFKNDPLIQKALEVFKGRIVEVRA